MMKIMMMTISTLGSRGLPHLNIVHDYHEKYDHDYDGHIYYDHNHDDHED